MYGGGGFGDAGASQFNGAGFMPSQGGNTGGGGQSSKKSFDSKQQTLRAVTIKQLHDALATSQDDSLVLDGRELTNLTFVAKILSINEGGVTFMLKVDDGTGKVDVKIWINEDDSEVDRQRRAQWRPGMYVRVHGHFSNFGQSQDVLAFNVRLVADHNEITYHQLQCIFQHAHLTKGGGGAAAAATPGGMKQEGGYVAPVGGGYGGAPAAGYNPNAGMNAVHQDIMKLFNAPDAQASDAGISIDDVLARAGGRYSLVQVREAVDALQNEGHLYSTIDENHFKSCDV